MKVGAIIAEYNPFHNGHKYQIEQFRKKSGVDYVIVIMSGNFIQRGEPAWMPKHLRAKMALLGGADLIIELPLYYATGSASLFAQGAIEHLNALGCVDELCFGCECEESLELFYERLNTAADFIIKEPEEYKHSLLGYLKKGFSYPAARYKALDDFIMDKEILSTPNNILALEYTIALKKSKSTILPKPIVRLGPGYHSLNSEHTFASATALRNLLSNKPVFEDVQGLTPEGLNIIKENYHHVLPMNLDDFSMVFSSIFFLNKEYLTDYIDVNEDIANLMIKRFDTFKSLNQYLFELKNKAYTYTRLSRCVTHIMTQQKKHDFGELTQDGYAHYARVLGFKKASSRLLSSIKMNSSIPLITKLADYSKQLNPTAASMLEMDIAASHLYRMVQQMKFQNDIKNEFNEQIVII